MQRPVSADAQAEFGVVAVLGDVCGGGEGRFLNDVYLNNLKKTHTKNAVTTTTTNNINRIN